jgi:hypothetical protein
MVVPEGVLQQMKSTMDFQYEKHPASESLMPMSPMLFETHHVRGSEILIEYEELIRPVESLAIVQNFIFVSSENYSGLEAWMAAHTEGKGSRLRSATEVEERLNRQQQRPLFNIYIDTYC